MMMPMIREETKMLMAQFRRNISSNTRGVVTATTKLNVSADASQPLAKAQQQRHLQNVTVGTSVPSFDAAMLSSMLRQSSVHDQIKTFRVEDVLPFEEASAEVSSTSTSATTTSFVTDSKIVNEGKQIEISFNNGTRYAFHTSWLKDSAADNFGGSFNRNCPHAGDQARGSIATRASAEEAGEKFCVQFNVGGVDYEHEFDTRWLHAFAPYAAKAIVGETKQIATHGAMLHDLTIDAHKTSAGHWGAEKDVASFTCEDLSDDQDMQKHFLEVMARDGVAVIYDVPPPPDLSSERIGETLEAFVNKVVGAMYQPPRRKTNYGIMRADMSALNIGNEEALADYNFKNPLSMHTDHAIYEETPGYLQWNWQAQGSVTTKGTNGISVAEYIRETNPRAFHLLSTIHVTHAVRTNHYTFDGEYANSPGRYHEGTFEQMHTHPIIKLDADGNVVQVIHNELKRGVSAIPFDVYDEFNEAYSLWKDLCEDPRFTKEVDWPEHSVIVLNNHFVLHGRASPVPHCQKERIMVWGYSRKDITENRYRLLKQRDLEVSRGISDDLTRTVPNQILQGLEVE